MSGIYDHIKQMFDQHLHSNVIALANFVLSVSDHNPEIMSTSNKFKTYVHYGDSLYSLGQYRKAENVYRKALLFKKSLIKCKGAKLQDNHKETIPDIDIKYQIHLCLLNLKQNHQAIGVLQTIPGKQRSSKINMALAKLYHQEGMERSAVSAYKEVLRECPLAMEAVEGLLSLGVKGAEVASFMLDGTSTLPNMEWLTTWVRARAHFYAKEYMQAGTLLRQLDDRTVLRDNPTLLVALGECLHHAGDYAAALTVLLRAHSLEPHLRRGLDILAALLAGERRLRELERCIAPVVALSEYGPETWVAMGYYAHAVRKNAKAVYFAHKACLIDPRNVEALILKGLVLLEMKKWQEAGLHFREAVHLAPQRYEPHRGLADCYIAMHRTREALTVASSACKQLGQTPRVLTLYASVLMKDPVGSARAKGLLEKALQQERTHLPAVYLLAEIYEQEMMLENAVALLKEQVDIQPTCKLHQMLGDLLARMHDEEKALDHYSIALNLDPSNRRALEGMHRLDVAGSGTAGTPGAPPQSSKLDSSSYYMSASQWRRRRVGEGRGLQRMWVGVEGEEGGEKRRRKMRRRKRRRRYPTQRLKLVEVKHRLLICLPLLQSICLETSDSCTFQCGGTPCKTWDYATPLCYLGATDRLEFVSSNVAVMISVRWKTSSVMILSNLTSAVTNMSSIVPPYSL